MPETVFELLSAGDLQLVNQPTFVNAPPNLAFQSLVQDGRFSVTVVPEPSTIVILCVACGSIALFGMMSNHRKLVIKG